MNNKIYLVINGRYQTDCTSEYGDSASDALQIKGFFNTLDEAKLCIEKIIGKAMDNDYEVEDPDGGEDVPTGWIEGNEDEYPDGKWNPWFYRIVDVEEGYKEEN